MNIVLVHGFSSLKGEERLKLLIEEIKKNFPAAKIIVPNYLEKYSRLKLMAGRRTISDYAERCKEIIEKESSNGAMIIVGYSMGGLIARILVERMGVQVKAVILVGTPNKGIELSRLEKWLLKLIKRPCIEEMQKGSEFLKNLNEGPIPSNYYYIGGRFDKKVLLDSSLPSEILEDPKRYAGAKIVDTNHSGLIPKKPLQKPNAVGEIIKSLKKEINLSTPSFLFT